MSQRGRPAARKPASKFPHLRKQQLKDKLQSPQTRPERNALTRKPGKGKKGPGQNG